MSDKELEQEISKLENDVKRLEDSTKEIIQSIKERIQNLKDIAWDRQSKKESSQMYKVLKEEKESTQVKSNVGDIKVDKDFMEKEIQKHLDNPNLRGMVTTEEMLSFPKVARNVEAEYNPQYQGYNWQVKANDENIINYGERNYGEGHRLLTAYSKTERGELCHSHRQINDPDFHNSADRIIPQPQNKIEQSTIQSQTSFDANIFSNLSPAERLTQLQRNQEVISQMPKASEILNHQESTNDLASLERNSHQDSKESTLKHQYKRMLK